MVVWGGGGEGFIEPMCCVMTYLIGVHGLLRLSLHPAGLICR